MRKIIGAIAVAALATATAQADPGGGKGGGKGQDHPAGQDSGPGKGKGQGGGDKVRGPDRAHIPVLRSPLEVPRGVAERGDKGKGQGQGARAYAPARGVIGEVVRRSDNPRTVWREIDRHGLVNGCPPGLAKKNNGCMPPGLAKKRDDYPYNRDWWGLRGLSDMAGYRYYDGSLVRTGANGGILGYYPLLGGALAVGNPWPSAYAPVPLDPYTVNYYGLGQDYRYFDGALYRLDPQTQAINAIAGLLTGDDFGVGQRMPLGYDVYNVPYDYRDRYVDGPDAMYRYGDGRVYQVDPKTRLIVAALELLT